MRVETVGILGYGHFGKFLRVLINRFAPNIQVRVFSHRFSPDNEVFFSLEDAASCDVVVLCGSMHDYEKQLLEVLPYTHSETILVDVATVKKYPTEIFQKHAGNRRWISTHPMFGPESYKKRREDVSGFRVIVTDYTLPNDTFIEFRNFLANLGFVIVEMSADEHDKLLASTLFLTHYIGQTMEEGGFGRTNIDTASFSFLMDAVESVVGDKKLFEDVYRFNPYCKEVAERFHSAQEKVLNTLPSETDSSSGIMRR